MSSLAVATAGLLVACSSSNGGSNTGGTGGSSSSTVDLTAVKAEVAKYMPAPTTTGVEGALSAKPATGKKVIFMNNPTPDAKEIGDGLQAAAAKLGWSFTRINYEVTAQSEQGAFNQAIAQNPDAIFDSAAPATGLEAQRAAMAKKNISFVTCCALYPSGTPNPPLGVVEGGNSLGFNGLLNADWAISKSNAQVNALIVTIPDFTVLGPFVDEQQKRYQEICPKTCKSTVMKAQVTDIGTNIPGMITSALQRDPSINYISFTSGSLSTGVPAALAQAGLTSKVHLIGESPVATNLANLRAGTEEMYNGVALTVLGWRLADVYARHLAGQTFTFEANTADDTGPTAYMPTQFLTKDSAPTGTEWLAPADYQAVFAKLWNLGS
jgi:ribose transport system substrate-binding protein